MSDTENVLFGFFLVTFIGVIGAVLSVKFHQFLVSINQSKARMAKDEKLYDIHRAYIDKNIQRGARTSDHRFSLNKFGTDVDPNAVADEEDRLADEYDRLTDKYEDDGPIPEGERLYKLLVAAKEKERLGNPLTVDDLAEIAYQEEREVYAELALPTDARGLLREALLDAFKQTQSGKRFGSTETDKIMKYLDRYIDERIERSKAGD